MAGEKEVTRTFTAAEMLERLRQFCAAPDRASLNHLNGWDLMILAEFVQQELAAAPIDESTPVCRKCGERFISGLAHSCPNNGNRYTTTFSVREAARLVGLTPKNAAGPQNDESFVDYTRAVFNAMDTLSPAEAFDGWLREYRLRTTPLQRIHVTPLSATPAEPTTAPAAAGPKRCGTCKHWEGPQFKGDMGLCREWSRVVVAADGSGFCHLHEAKP